MEDLRQEKEIYIQNIAYITKQLYAARVCVAGGGQIDKALVNSADLVVCTNDHYLADRPCDIVVVGRKPKPKRYYRDTLVLLREYGGQADWLTLFKNKTIVSYCADIHQGVCNYGVENERFQRLARKLRTKPLTGIIAVDWLLSFPIRSLLVTGMDFYSRSGKQPYQVGPHLIKPQVDYLRDLVRFDARVEVDAQLRLLLQPAVSEPSRLIRVTERVGDLIWSVQD